MVHVGVDLDKRSSQIAVLTEEGEIAQQRLPNDPVQLEKFFAELPPFTPVAIEASGTWWWLVDLLERLGHHPVLSHPKQTKAIAAARLKNDRVDAERLALLLRGDLLPTVWIPSAALRGAPELPRHRARARARRHPALRGRQAARQLRGADAARPQQRGARPQRAHQQRRQSPAALGVGVGRDASHSPARSAPRLVSRGEKAPRQEGGAGRA